MITVIDYGMGNLRSVVKAIELYTADVRIARDVSEIKGAKALVMPGDGAFGAAMENLTNRGWIGPIKEHIASGGYFLGICLGYQLLFSSSEEFGEYKGLDIIPGSVVRFPESELKVPHMGWNAVNFTRSSKFLAGIPNGAHFYFIHTYYPVPDNRDVILGEAEYGNPFACIVEKGNLIATQFHPEKSHSAGLK
ncbi:MAG TPA: imidazole glycerol phosphate synthase subunit HisH, partial [Spirochaetota bacterium]